MTPPHPTYITGRIELSDGSVTEFYIDSDLGWQQWGNFTEKLGATVDLLDALATAAAEAGLREVSEDDHEEAS